MSHDGSRVHVYPESINFNAAGWWGGDRMAGCRCWQRSELFVPAVEDSTQMSSWPVSELMICTEEFGEKGDFKWLHLPFEGLANIRM